MTMGTKLDDKRGVAVTEFVIVFPTFLIFSMFVIEISLMWADRHVLRLAAFEAARALVIEAHVTDSSSSVCWPENPQNQTDQQLKDRLVSVAKTAAVNKVAVIAPTITYFAGQVPGLSQGAAVLDSALSVGQGSTGRYLAAFKRFVLAWPMAWAMTTPKCTESNGIVTINLEYQRAPRMPYVGSLLWAIRATSKINDTTQSAINVNISELDYYGLRTDLNVAQATAQIQSARNELKDSINIMKNMDWDHLSGSASPLNGLISANVLDPIFTANGVVDTYADTALNLVQQARSVVQKASPIVTAIVYAVPENLRLVPMNVEVKMSKGLPGSGNPNRDWQGRAFLVAPLTTGIWNDWTQKMQTVE
jgi:hypothetical protein